MSKAQWEKIKSKDKSKTVGKDLGKTGVTSFKSRSFMEWQKDGGKHLFPVDPKSVKSQKEIPYMQRAGGSADGEDLKGGKKGAPSLKPWRAAMGASRISVRDLVSYALSTILSMFIILPSRRPPSVSVSAK